MMAAFKARFGKSTSKLQAEFSAANFANPRETCDLVMKGGVTSGVVYPYAILELAQHYRFCSIGGTSAGGIAAAFAAAAEFARSRNDPEGFVRLESRCLQLPERLSSLFQAEPGLQPLMTIALAVSRGGWLRIAIAVLAALWLPVLVGALSGAGLAWALKGGLATMILSGVLGLIACIVVGFLWLVLVELRRNDFGLCRGLGGNSTRPALTEWLYEALQFIAWGDGASQASPLTFGDLDSQGITLRMITTNLSLRRPHALPAMIDGVMFEESRWTRLFPKAVMDHLLRVCGKAGLEDYRHCPKPKDMPVLMAVRMSLSFPFLISAIPMLIRDLGAERRAKDAAREQALEKEVQAIEKNEEAPKPDAPRKIIARLWFSDGGLTSNFPIHFFDAPLPQRPTFALSLDDLPENERAPSERVRTQMKASEGIFLPIADIRSVGAFAGALLGAAKDWQDTLLSGMPGQRERIVRVALRDDEGGLNLDMPVDRSNQLMKYGRQAGVKLKAEFRFDEHRWRRALVAYEQLEKTVEATAPVWKAGFGDWLATYEADSYKKNAGENRRRMVARLQAFADLAGEFDPALRGKPDLFPRPPGRLRITPDV